MKSFGNNSQTCIGSDGPCKSPGTPKLWTIAHKNGHRTRKQRVLGDALKHISGLTIVVNLPLTPKLWAITHEKTIKRKNIDFLVISLKHVSVLTVFGNRP